MLCLELSDFVVKSCFPIKWHDAPHRSWLWKNNFFSTTKEPAAINIQNLLHASKNKKSFLCLTTTFIYSLYMLVIVSALIRDFILYKNLGFRVFMNHWSLGFWLDGWWWLQKLKRTSFRDFGILYHLHFPPESGLTVLIIRIYCHFPWQLNVFWHKLGHDWMKWEDNSSS